MKILFTIAALFITLASISALPPDLDDELADEDDPMGTVMSNALLSSLLEGDQDGEDSIMANIMKSNEEEAEAQFRFIRRLFTWFRNSRVGQFVGQQLRNRFCTSGRKNLWILNKLVYIRIVIHLCIIPCVLTRWIVNKMIFFCIATIEFYGDVL